MTGFGRHLTPGVTFGFILRPLEVELWPIPGEHLHLATIFSELDFENLATCKIPGDLLCETTKSDASLIQSQLKSEIVL